MLVLTFHSFCSVCTAFKCLGHSLTISIPHCTTHPLLTHLRTSSSLCLWRGQKAFLLSFRNCVPWCHLCCSTTDSEQTLTITPGTWPQPQHTHMHGGAFNHLSAPPHPTQFYNKHERLAWDHSQISTHTKAASGVSLSGCDPFSLLSVCVCCMTACVYVTVRVNSMCIWVCVGVNSMLVCIQLF